METEQEKLNKESYFQVPKSLFRLRWNGGISLTAFDIYVLMLDRFKLSKKNNWVDEDGNTYINYSYEELLNDLDLKKKNIISEALKELEELKLITKKRRQRKSTVFYLNSYSNQVVTSKNSYSNQNDKNLSFKVTVSDSYSNQVVTSKTEKNTQKNIDIKRKKEGEKTPNKNNINKNNISNNNSIEFSSSLRNEIKFLLNGRKILIDRILKYSNSIERIREVINYANKHNKGDGYIISALKENYNFTGIKLPETHREERAKLDRTQDGPDYKKLHRKEKSPDPCKAGEKDYSLTIDEILNGGGKK